MRFEHSNFVVFSEYLTFTYLSFIVHFLENYDYDPVVRPDMDNLNNILRSLGPGGQKSFQYKNWYFFKTKTTITIFLQLASLTKNTQKRGLLHYHINQSVTSFYPRSKRTKSKGWSTQFEKRKREKCVKGVPIAERLQRHRLWCLERTVHIGRLENIYIVKCLIDPARELFFNN